MPDPIRPRLTYANVMATLAFFIAIGGTTIAATKIDGGQIEKGTVTGKALKNQTIRGKKLRPDTLSGVQIKEVALGKVPSASAADIAGNSATVGGRTAAQMTDSCPAGTTAYAGVCIETERRTAATWPAAAKTCGDAGGRLPGLEELEGFRQQPGVTLWFQGEHPSSYLDSTPIDEANGDFTVGIRDTGSRPAGFDYGNSAASFRCVFPLTDSR